MAGWPDHQVRIDENERVAPPQIVGVLLQFIGDARLGMGTVFLSGEFGYELFPIEIVHTDVGASGPYADLHLVESCTDESIGTRVTEDHQHAGVVSFAFGGSSELAHGSFDVRREFGAFGFSRRVDGVHAVPSP